ncbi:hypothetical protein ES332_D09G055000v1 [Gossypium tomentosum]|uniref:MULE transposase domain-containing protein n=1 Tax=Gossypium tomentosum TaxID=34277 RepID=A0A5D2JEJ2_GOSTO|nr:hypothetical protein ES332_D09G055000v1 [Gossypium tomentosum]
MATSPFFTNRVFESREELMQWVQNTTFSLGSHLKQYDGWTLRVICDQHNHPPTQHMKGHAYARRLKENEKKLLVDLTSKNVTPRDILSTLKEQDESNVSTLKTIYNARQKLRSSQNVGKTPIQLLMLLLNDKQFFTEFSVNNISNELENLFFIHPRSLDIWRAFQHILIVDATYKMNKYDLPFVQIVGMASTNKKFSIAFAFIINEKEENYNCTLTCLNLTLEECMYPCVIVTDRELALMNACQQVFPDATRLLCRWHITENIKKHCRQSIKSQHEWDSFLAMWTVLIESPTWILVESHHAKLKKYLCAKNSSLDKFVGCIDQIVKSQLTSIYESFEKSRIVLKHRHNLPCFRLLRKLDLSPSTFVENEDICCDGELEMFKEKFTNQSKAGKKSLLRKLRDIFQPISDFIDLNQMPESCDTHPLIKEILDMFHPYITHVQDVRGDGNCGFRAISVCLGYGKDQWLYVRHQLLDELLTSYDVYARVFTDGIDELRNSLCFSQLPAPAEHWMVMPMTGVLIANRFGVILNYLTKRCEITFFPLWREGDYPMPTISAYWIRHRAPSTAGWQTMYMSRLEFYRQLKPCSLKTPVITIEDYC